MSIEDDDALDKEVRRHVYEHTAREELPPAAAATAAALSVSPPEVKASFRRLAAAHVFHLQSEGDEILMAYPFSAVPTSFVVKSAGRSYYANCVWDALGIPVMLRQDARVEASCGCCGTAMNLGVVNGSLEEAEGVVHFALPAARWWDNIVFT